MEDAQVHARVVRYPSGSSRPSDRRSPSLSALDRQRMGLTERLSELLGRRDNRVTYYDMLQAMNSDDPLLWLSRRGYAWKDIQDTLDSMETPR